MWLVPANHTKFHISLILSGNPFAPASIDLEFLLNAALLFQPVCFKIIN